MLVGCVLVALWFVLVPVSALFYNAFTEDTGFGPGAFSLENFVEAYSSWQILALFRNSLVFAIGTALTTFALGGLVSWAVERTDAPGAALFHSLALLSFAIPGLLMAMAWIFVLSPNIGWANTLMKNAFGLAQAPLSIYTMAGMIWALSSHYFPLAYLSLGPALRVLDVRMEEAGLVSGGRTWQVLTKITLPLLRPAILSGMLILFVLGMSSYEVPRLIGRPARIDVFTTDIQSAIIQTPPEFGVASALALTLLAVCIVAVFFYRRATRHAEAFATITGKGYMPTRIKLGVWRWPVAIGIGLMFTLALGLPLLTLVWQSFFRNLALPFMGSDAPFTLDNYKFVLSYPIFLAAVKTSVMLAAMAATIVSGLTMVMAWVALRTRAALRLDSRCHRVRPDRDPGRDRGGRHPGRLSDAADPGLQHDLDPADRLCDLVPALRHALRVERDFADSSRARGGRRGGGRAARPGVLAHPAAAAGAGPDGGLDLRLRALGARARRLDLPGRSRNPCARDHHAHHVGGGRQLRRGLGARRHPGHPSHHHRGRPALAGAARATPRRGGGREGE